MHVKKIKTKVIKVSKLKPTETKNSKCIIVKPEEKIVKMVAPLQIPAPHHPILVPKTEKLTTEQIRRHTIKRKLSFDSQREDDSSKTVTHKKSKLDDLPFTSLKVPKHLVTKKKLPKKNKLRKRAYQLDPFDDPKLERCRKNAINAKKNRDLRKNRMEQLEKEVSLEKESNKRLSKENNLLKSDKRRLLDTINELSSTLSNPQKLAELLLKLQK